MLDWLLRRDKFVMPALRFRCKDGRKLATPLINLNYAYLQPQQLPVPIDLDHYTVEIVNPNPYPVKVHLWFGGFEGFEVRKVKVVE